jgi:uncharacterized membrane protein
VKSLDLARRVRALLWSLLLLWAGVAGAAAPVRVLLFHAPDCAGCGDLFGLYLPGLTERHGAALELALLDRSQEPGATLYAAAQRQLGAPPWAGEPVALVGERVLQGVYVIAATLGDELARLAADPAARDWPPLPDLAAALPDARAALTARLAGTAPPPPLAPPVVTAAERANALANALAVVVLAGMAVALVRVLLRVWRGRGRPGPAPAIAGLVLAGLVISAYTAYTALADVAPVCGPLGDCAAVQRSEYARLFGIPMGVLGLLAYAGLGLTWLLARYRSPAGGGWHWLPWLIALGGVLFSLRLTYLEPFVIGATCLWCLGSAVTITLLLWLLWPHPVPSPGSR